jgi:hypothetical protein
MSVAPKILYKKNSQSYRIVGLKDTSVSPSVYLNAATVTATLKDSSGASVAGFTDVSGLYTIGSNGIYDFPLDPELFDPSTGSGYVLIVSAVQNNKRWYVEAPIKIAVRRVGTEA